jgi:FkbM family methyltransferase
VSLVDDCRVMATLPVRRYIRDFPVQRGKGFLMRNVLKPLLPGPPSGFTSRRPGGTRVRLQYRERLGMSTLIYGPFEKAECVLMLHLAEPGSTVVDVGANIGVHTVPLADRVAPGTVIAVEPLAENIERLRENVAMNDLNNVFIAEAAAGDSDGRVTLQLADDPAYPSMESVPEGHGIGRDRTVAEVTVDKLWASLGRPRVTLLKVDVEGAEARVLAGSSHLLASERPAILAEASDAERLELIAKVLAPLGYAEVAHEIAGWNHLFLSRSATAPQSAS